MNNIKKIWFKNLFKYGWFKVVYVNVFIGISVEYGNIISDLV